MIRFVAADGRIQELPTVQAALERLEGLRTEEQSLWAAIKRATAPRASNAVTEPILQPSLDH